LVNIKLKNINKNFGEVAAAKSVNLFIEDGEFFTLLGPSGCGKTTIMRMIAGLEYPDEGTILFDGKDVTKEPSFKRNTGMVFQNYALWPHMSVEENVAYGLKIRKFNEAEIKKRVTEALEQVKLTGMGKRFPTQLSGGQQQRVALARVLVINPSVLLLDEPLSNLDAKLRVEMREEIKELQKRLGITTVYVTHDQEEALIISDRIAVQNKGEIKQIGTPLEIYDHPKDVFIATFIGKGTLLQGSISEKNKVNVDNYYLSYTNNLELKEGDKVNVLIRPESFVLNKPSEESNRLEGIIESITFVGQYTELKIVIGNFSIIVNTSPKTILNKNEKIVGYVPYGNTILLPYEELV